MFNPGDYVIYGDSGFCRVEQVAVPDFDTFEKGKPYYFLRSEQKFSGLTELKENMFLDKENAKKYLRSIRENLFV